MPATRAPSAPRAYLELVRPANVVTALADVLAGYTVAGAPGTVALAWLLPATACLYAGGVVFNDYCDRAVDARERPERPIPSGRVPAGRAAALAGLLLAAGVLLAFGAGRTSGLVALATAAAVVTYDRWGKPHPLIGPINMGACRGLNLALGIAAAPPALLLSWPLTLLPLGYITGVTVLSRGEVAGGRRPVAVAALGLVAVVLAALAGLAFRAPRLAWWALLLTAVLAWRVLPPFWRAVRTLAPDAIRRAVRAGVLSLVLLDAVIAAVYADMIVYSLVVLATAVLAGWLARRFAVT